jgi:hypothetical protein
MEAALISGTPVLHVARDFGANYDSLRGHVRRHLPAALEEAIDPRDIPRLRTLRERLEILLHEAANILNKARDGTIIERVAAANTVLKIQESIGRRTGEIKSPSEEAVFARLGASENEVKVALDMARANKSRSLDDHLYNCTKLTKFVLDQRPELRKEAAAELLPVLKEPEALPARTNGAH